MKTIAKWLNAEGAPSPRAQQGRSRSWAPTSVRDDVLHRPIYRGEIVWARTAKRDTWGRKRQAARPEADWIRRPAPALRIVSEADWAAAHTRLAAVRGVYLAATTGRPYGRPPLGDPSKYLLTNLALWLMWRLAARALAPPRERPNTLLRVFRVSRTGPDGVQPTGPTCR